MQKYFKIKETFKDNKSQIRYVTPKVWTGLLKNGATVKRRKVGEVNY